ncbi:hypothetical protein [Burkholderia cepacia]|uniref:hypothetical protein n=1 Tax=Burkholderia cepacia TaxID=292 RepID=UPI001F27176B|nr:hypothetical protein [Burkholderia cepacia]UIY60055.1 hypothetical protein LZ568_18640 [Burkholderia cepacia]
MARIRTIKPDFWTDEKVVELSFEARLFFIGSWNFADDNGNLQRSARKLKMQIFPADAIDCEPVIQSLITHGLLTEYEVDGEKYLHINGFRKHQVINRPSKTGLPTPESGSTPAPLSESSLTEGKGKEGKGRDKTVGAVVSVGKPAQSVTDDFRPKDAAEWLRHLRDRHGFEADPTNVNDRKKLWPVFASWTNAGLTTAFVDAAIATAIRDASEPIVCLPLYVDRCMANANAARASPNPSWTDQNAQTIAALTGRNRSHEPDDRTIDV